MKPFLIYDFATAPLGISLYMRKIFFNSAAWGCGNEMSSMWADIKTSPYCERYFREKETKCRGYGSQNKPDDVNQCIKRERGKEPEDERKLTP